MSLVTIEDRVDRLEALFGQFMTETLVLDKRADERNKAAEERMTRFENGMTRFENEMHVLNKRADERNKAAEERMTRFENGMTRFENEMQVLNKRADERNKAAEERMSRFENEVRGWKRDMNKQWGDLANKLGTIIEDILAPNLRRMAFEHFRFDAILDFMLRRSRRRPDRPEVESEFDVIVVGATAVILGEAKSTPSLEYADAFAAKAGGFYDFFPEYRGRRLIPVFGSWAIVDSIVDRLTRHGIYAMRMGEDTMELANAAALDAR